MMPTASVSPELEAGPDAEVRPDVGVSLRSNIQWALVGNVVYAACQWGILIVLAKMVTPESVGQFALGLAITAPVMLFANLQLGAVQATDARRDFRFGHYLALRIVTNALALIVVAGIALCMGANRVTAVVVLVIGVAKAFEMISDAYHGLMQLHSRMERVAWSLIIKGVLSLIGVTAWLWGGGGVMGAAGAMAVMWGLVLVGYDIPSTAWLRRVEAGSAETSFVPCWQWREMVRLFWGALPIGIRVILFTLSFNIPRYLSMSISAKNRWASSPLSPT